jgi:uncharacterized membrane protein YgdD (TMEM256/DUF423 family)
MDLVFYALASLFGALGVAFGAFGTHALRERFAEGTLDTFETGVRYQFYHALALFGVALGVGRWPGSPLPLAAGWLFVAGVIVFSGSLYGLALTGNRRLGAIAPIGGVMLILGWLCLMLAVLQTP